VEKRLPLYYLKSRWLEKVLARQNSTGKKKKKRHRHGEQRVPTPSCPATGTGIKRDSGITGAFQKSGIKEKGRITG